MKIRTIAPHLIFFAALALIVLVGAIANVGVVAVFLGSFLAFLTDPLLLFGALFIGALVRPMSGLAALTLALALALSLYVDLIGPYRDGHFSVGLLIVRWLAAIAVALVANIVRRLGHHGAA